MRSADGQIRIPGFGVTLSGDFLDQAEASRIAFGDIALKDGIRILHGDRDAVAPLQESIRLIEALAPRGDSHLRVYPGAGHELSKLKGLPGKDLFHECDELLKLAAGVQVVGA